MEGRDESDAHDADGAVKKRMAFTGVRCYTKPAWRLADGKYGNDGDTVSMIAGCLILRTNPRHRGVCDIISGNSMKMRLSLSNESSHDKMYSKAGTHVDQTELSNTVTSDYENEMVIVIQFSTNPITDRVNRKAHTPMLLTELDKQRYALDINTTQQSHFLHTFVHRQNGTFTNTSELLKRRSNIRMDHNEYNNFAVCAIQTNRNPLSPYQVYMFVAHYLSLGFRVIVYDRMGLHISFIQEFFVNPYFDYYPYSMLEIAWPEAIDLSETKNFKYKVYYAKEKKSASDVHADVANDARLQDRDKMMTFDHARIEYSVYEDVKGMMFVDIDEFLFCPKEAASINAQRAHIKKVLNKLHDVDKIDELRVDVHPYSAINETFNTIHKCFHSAIELETARTPIHDSSTKISNDAGTYVRLTAMHRCFSSVSTSQMWPKSFDFRRKCPFHYNHWSCDGGKAAGRQLGCHCKVSLEWYKKTKKPSTDMCHLMHYNHHTYKYQSHRSRRGKHESHHKFVNANSVGNSSTEKRESPIHKMYMMQL